MGVKPSVILMLYNHLWRWSNIKITLHFGLGIVLTGTIAEDIKGGIWITVYEDYNNNHDCVILLHEMFSYFFSFLSILESQIFCVCENRAEGGGRWFWCPFMDIFEITSFRSFQLLGLQ